MNHDELLSKLKEDKKVLPGVLEGNSRETFRRSFESVFSCDEARNAKGVVYVWATVNPIPRLKSRSNVVYIGKTVTSLFHRHHKYASLESEGENDYNWRRYEHIFKNYGPISVYYSVQENPRDAERKLIEQYFECHLEVPPLNRMS